ncbi:MAG: zinc ABC transporter substrate-binding protein, partial [Dehalococcoidia bacterium]|nr:zinc ABC transporter substrate-binding protein [Dehalococcoidia bacterium]
HSFVPGAGDVAKVEDADVLLTVGLGLEVDWLEDLLHNASADESSIVALGEEVDPLEFTEVDVHDEQMDGHSGTLVGRLLIGDGEEGSISVIDLETGGVEQDQFDLGSRAGRIYSTKSGRYAIAVSSDANTAHLFDGGIFMEAHGDHSDLVEGDIRKLPVDLSGDRPVHLYVGDEWATIFYDGSGDVVLINEHDLEEQGDSYVPVRVNAGAHHGAALPLEDDLFAVSIQHPDYAQDPQEYGRPIGAEIRDLDGNVLHRAEGCDSLHGDASNGHMAVFGCIGGVLVLEAHDGEYSHAFIAPDEPIGDSRLTSVWGYSGLDHFFALGSEVGLYIVEPEEEEMELLIPASEELWPIQVHVGAGGETLLVVMSDGELRMYDAHDGDLQATKTDFLTPPVETGFWARPHLTTAPGAIFITDSVGGRVLQLDDHDLEEVTHWDVAGVPTKIAFVGILGDQEDDGDAHGHGPLDPHFWFDPNRVKIAVKIIAARFSALDPEGTEFYFQNAADYEVELDELHSWTKEQVALVPPERRLLVTSHDTFGYFADVYGFEIIGALIPSLAPDVEPSAEHMAGLVEVVREHNVPAVFSETTVSDKLPEALARETGASLVQVYADSLGERGSPGGTYLGMVRTNVERIVEALK